MVSSNKQRKSNMRTLIAKETELPGVFHIPTSSNSTTNALNEAVITAAMKRIDWNLIGAKN